MNIRLCLLAAAFAASFSPVLAADYDPPIVVDDAPEYQPVEVGSGWYLRGDVGYNFAGRYRNDTYDEGEVSHDDNFQDSLTGSVAVGYHVNDYLRAEVALDRVFGSDFKSQVPVAPTGPCNGYGTYIDTVSGVSYIDDFDIENCLREDSASYDSWLVMANVYADLGTYAGFTPYVGAGLGGARVTYHEETDSITCVPRDGSVHFEGCNATGSEAQPEPNTVYTEPGTEHSGTDFRVAWSLTAGFSYLLTQNLSLDSGYRYIRVGGSENSIVYNDTPGSSIAKDGFSVHQVRVGLRYDLW